jgi:hypothetical protein
MILRLITKAQIAWLRWTLRCNDVWMWECWAAGIAETESMREWARQADATQARIDRLEDGL